MGLLLAQRCRTGGQHASAVAQQVAAGLGEHVLAAQRAQQAVHLLRVARQQAADLHRLRQARLQRRRRLRPAAARFLPSRHPGMGANGASVWCQGRHPGVGLGKPEEGFFGASAGPGRAICRLGLSYSCMDAKRCKDLAGSR